MCKTSITIFNLVQEKVGKYHGLLRFPTAKLIVVDAYSELPSAIRIVVGRFPVLQRQN
jgi:hypothetical protein